MMQSWLDNLEDKIIELREENAELKQALQCLANMDIRHMEGLPDDRPVYAMNFSKLTLGDIRRAKELVPEEVPNEESEI